jgi:hypothetical protein
MELTILTENYEDPIRRRRRESEVVQVLLKYGQTEVQDAEKLDEIHISELINRFVDARLLVQSGEDENKQIEVAQCRNGTQRCAETRSRCRVREKGGAGMPGKLEGTHRRQNTAWGMLRALRGLWGSHAPHTDASHQYRMARCQNCAQRARRQRHWWSARCATAGNGDRRG